MGAAPLRGMGEPERLDVSVAELEAILERVRPVLPPADFAALQASVRMLVWLTGQLEHKRVSLARLQRILFGATTERTQAVLAAALATGGPPALAAAGVPPAAPAAAPTPAAPPPPPGHGRHAAVVYAGAERIPVPHPTLTPKAPCPDCVGGKVYRLAAPQVLVRVRGQAPLVATCYELETLRCHLCGRVFPAPPPPGVGPEKYDATAGAMVACLKYGSGLPFHRLARLEGQLGVPLPAATQWDLVAGVAATLAPAYAALVRQAAQGEVLHNDDTTMRILARMGKRGQRAALAEGASHQARAVFTSGIVAVGGGHRLALFCTGPRHAGENLARVLAQRAAALAAPIQMCDALTRNLPGELETIVAHCLAHGRRRFVEVVAEFPEACRHVLEQLGAVYRVDAVARGLGLDPDARLAFHQARSGPVMAALHAWFEAQLADRRVEPNSSLGEAIAYMQKHWDALTLFLRVPGAPLDNNVCEQALKKAILHRKNALFYRSDHGAAVGDLFMSLIYSAELAGANPFDYLTALQVHADAVAEAPEQWLPWTYAATRDAREAAAPAPA